MSNKEDLNKENEKLEVEETVVENVETSNDEKVEEKIVEEKVVNNDAIFEEEAKVDAKPSLGKRIFANFLDQAITLGFSAIILVIFGLIIKIFGYAIAMPVPMLLIAYIVVNILYYPLFEKTDGKTIGKRILAI